MTLDRHEDELLRHLQNRRRPVSDRDPRRWTLGGFVLAHGWFYKPMPTPACVRPGTPSECFTNAFVLAMADPSVIYCEGYAMHVSGGDAVLHAWVTDGDGNVIDNTWPTVGVAYAGMPFKIEYLNRRYVKNRAIITALDDYLHGWPLLMDGGEPPEAWMDKTGVGVKPLAAIKQGP